MRRRAVFANYNGAPTRRFSLLLRDNEPMPELLRLEQLRLRRGSQLLGASWSFSLHTRQKIGLVGANGVGKSSLLMLIAQQPCASLQLESGVLWRAPGLHIASLLAASSESPASSTSSKPAKLLETPESSLGTLEPPNAQTVTLWHYARSALQRAHRLEQSLYREAEKLSHGQSDLAAYAAAQQAFEDAGGYHAEVQLRRWLERFGFSRADDAQAVASLTAGERQRLRLACLLSENADILLLDEPSLHLDWRHRYVLRQALQAYPGSLLLASHDRALQDAVCSHSLYLEPESLRRYRGGYSHSQQQRQQERQQQQREQHEQHKEQQRLQQSNARLQSWGNAAAQRQRKQQARRYQTYQDLQSAQTAPLLSPTSAAATASTANTALVPRASGDPTLLRVQQLRLERGDTVLLTLHALHIDAGDRIALIGENGSGKSSLLACLAGVEAANPQSLWHWGSHKLFYLDAKQRGLDATPLRDTLQRYVSRPRAHSLLHKWGLSAQAQARPEQLSTGQRSRAGLALMEASEAALCLLDDPSEGLDIAHCEQLEQHLQQRQGAVLFVSHDEALVRAVATRIWSIQDGELVEFRGGVDGYLRGERRQEPNLHNPQPSDSLSKRELSSHKDKQAQALSERQHLQQQLEHYEDSLLALAAQQWQPAISLRQAQRLRQQAHALQQACDSLYQALSPLPAPAYRAVDGAICLRGDRWDCLDAVDFALTLPQGLLATLEPMHRAWCFSVHSHDTLLPLCLLLLCPDARPIAHIRLHALAPLCLVPAAQLRLLRLLARVAFEWLELHSLQYQIPAHTPQTLQGYDTNNAGNTDVSNADNGNTDDGSADDNTDALHDMRDLQQAGFYHAGQGWWLHNRQRYERQEGYMR